jgi:acyl transferase domain-containing protein
MAHACAEVDPRTISYVEGHGTATPLGDPIEVEALTRAFRLRTEDSGFCALGSVKSNLGHLVMAAGAAGLIGWPASKFPRPSTFVRAIPESISRAALSM